MAFSNLRAFATTRAALPDSQWQHLFYKAGIACLITFAFIWMLANRLSDIRFDAAPDQLFAVSFPQWLAASLATLVSFWAVGHYDGVIHRHLATGARRSDARRAGATAIAVSQTLGLGVISGAILRWRMLPDQTLWQATKITSLVALFFTAGLAIVTALVLTAIPQAPFKPYAAIVLCIGGGLIITSAIAPRFRNIRWPNLFVSLRLIGWTALDTLAAALALWALCPPDLAMPFATLLPAFLLAFGAGLISGAPGGAGAFELTLLAMLPNVPEAPLLIAILGWRVVYYAAPALIGAAFAIRGPARRRAFATRPLCLPDVTTASRAETGLCAQAQLQIIPAGHGQAWLSGRTAHCLIGLLDPLAGDPQTGAESCEYKRAIAALIDTAHSESRLPVLYKCTARTAVAARQLGLKLRPIGREAWLDPRKFDLTTPSRAGIRRKLRRATAAGICIINAPQDWARLAQINADWAAAHGGERGFSMGRFDRNYLSGQHLYVALQDGIAIAFVSFHVGKYEWTLDLMRHVSRIPDGTMQMLIAHAIADAAAQNLPRLSLAAVPFAALRPRPSGCLARQLHRAFGGGQTGLAQFKSSFVPNWQTLYLAAPQRAGLVLAGAEIAREVLFPAPVLPALHHNNAEYEIATSG